MFNKRCFRNPGHALVLLAGMSMTFIASGGEGTDKADFHAIGHEPDWHLEIHYDSKQLDFTSEQGTGSYSYVRLGPDLSRDSIRTFNYRVVHQDHSMHVAVLEKFCQDTQSGRAYGATVRVMLDGRNYQGCGEAVVERSTGDW